MRPRMNGRLFGAEIGRLLACLGGCLLQGTGREPGGLALASTVRYSTVSRQHGDLRASNPTRAPGAGLSTVCARRAERGG